MISKVTFSKWIVHSTVTYVILPAIVPGTRYEQPWKAHIKVTKPITGMLVMTCLLLG